MGKYGSGVSMKSVIEMEVAEVEGILDRNHIAEIDKKAVLDALKEMAYQWCQSNAGSCAVEAVLKERYKDTWDDMIKHLVTNETYNRVRMEKIEATFPDWDEDEEDEGWEKIDG